MKLYDYFRSSAAYRVRIAMNLKELNAEREFVHLRKGEQRSDAYRAVNPQKLVPTLVDGDAVLSQSLAIIEYLDETKGGAKLMPADALGRARVRQLAQLVACDIHPINNLRVLGYLTGKLGLSEEARDEWYRHWVKEGFEALEALLQDKATGRFCHGDNPTLADICLVPQVFNGLRFKVDMSPYPTIARINEACNALEAFAAAKPDRQPDTE